MISSAAYLLVFHGSRDCRTQAAASELKRLLSIKCQSINMLAQGNHLEANPSSSKLHGAVNSNSKPFPLIEIAALELTSIPLSESLINFARKARQQGIKQIKVVPLFLTSGVHVQQDIPAEVSVATNQIDCQLTIKLSPYLGKYSGIVPLLSRQFAQLPAKSRILITHGTRLPVGAIYYQNLAAQLDADLAYWSTTPWFTDKIKMQIASGIKKIALMPYFLFPGKITAAIAQEVADLQQEYPQVELFLGEPLGATAALAELIAEEI
ncbi:MAG: CbiX/SirB N-terminal domain-containing protein [Cyanobacteria bacterium P01_G01_bin.67]